MEERRRSAVRADPSTLWHQRSFRLLWAGQSISFLGTQVTVVALPLTAVLTLGATPAQMGVLTAAHSAPLLVVGLIAGVWVDRLRRRPILIASDAGRALLFASIPLASLVGGLTMAQLYLVGLSTGVLATLSTVAWPSFVPAVAGRERLVAANSSLAVSRQVASVAGPSLAGGLVQLVTAPVAVLVDAASFLVSAVLLGVNRVPEAPPTRERSHLVREMGDGLRFVWREPLIRTISLVTGSLSLFGGILSALFVVYVTRTLDIAPTVLGIAFAAGGAGGLLGATVAARAVRRFGAGSVLVGSLLLTGVAVALLPGAGAVPAVAAPLLLVQQALFTFGAVVYSVNAISLLQLATPAHVLGRMNATTRVLAEGTRPVGALLGGTLATVLGVQPTLVLTAVGVGLAVLVASASPLRSPAHTVPEGPDATASPAIDDG